MSNMAAQLIDVSKHFSTGRSMGGGGGGTVRAVDGVSLEIPNRSTVGLVGETGSGKSTISRLLLRLIPPTTGQVLLDEVDITSTSGAELRRLRRKMQLVFQDPYSCFDPLASIGNSIEESIKVHRHLSRQGRRAEVAQLLDSVGLSPVMAGRRPRDVSGGQLQRAAIARALAVDPGLIALDEPVSSLDMSTQAQVINLLLDLQDRLKIAYLFISHDLSVVRHISDRLAVMYLGRLVEVGPADVIYKEPKHPYTRALLAAIPIANPTVQRGQRRNRPALAGDIPSPLHPPDGCRFHTRCPEAMEQCAHIDPPAATDGAGRTVYCHLYPPTPLPAPSPTQNGTSGG